MTILSGAGKILHSVTLPERSHSVALDPISCKPVTSMLVFDHTGRDELLTISSIAGCHYYGHGVFSPDHALLYVTENDFGNAGGMVGVYRGARRLTLPQ